MAKSVKKAKTDGKGTHDYAFYDNGWAVTS